MTIIPENILTHINFLEKSSAEEVLEWTADKYKENVVLSSAFGPECQVLLDMIHKKSVPIPVFTLDTGRLFNETYKLIAETEEHYNTKIRVYFPDREDVEGMVSENGINLFYKNVELRKQCCHVRKLIPLERALKGKKCWITGLRKTQSETRDKMEIIELDNERNLIKINPLINWTEKQIWNYIRKNKVPYNPLHDQGYPSLGCACCTRRIKQGDNFRSGRWWWEKPEHKECGLHIKNGQIIRTK
jgi:phosphoadenosine phosphosulfate reductase